MKKLFLCLVLIFIALYIFSQSNVIEIDGKTFILTQAGYYSYSDYYGDEIVIFIATESFDINLPLNQQSSEDFSFIWFIYPGHRLETIEFSAMTEGAFYHSDNGRGSYFKTQRFRIEYDGENINLHIGYNLYNGIQMRTTIEELDYIGQIYNVDIYNIYGEHIWIR